MFVGDQGTNPAQAVPAGDATRVFSGSANGRTFALNAETGDVLWTQTSPVSYPAFAFDPAVDGGQVFYGFAENGGLRGGLAAFNAQTGSLQWFHDFSQYV